MPNPQCLFILAAGTILSSCSLSPDFTLPEIKLPVSFKEQPAQPEEKSASGDWKPAVCLGNEDRKDWWSIFGDERLNALEKQAAQTSPSLQAAAARVAEARATAAGNVPSFLPDLDIGANGVRTQPANASLAAFGQPGRSLKPYTLYNAQGELSYEVDFLGQVRDNYKAFIKDADAQEAAYRSALLSLQADVASDYFSLRELDAERALLRDTVKVYAESDRIMQSRFKHGDASLQDTSRTQADLASTQADLLALDRQRAATEHALAVLLGRIPSEFTFDEVPLQSAWRDAPPEIPPGLPSTLLERRPDIAAAVDAMAAANLRIGVARTAFFPSLILTASGGYESTHLRNLFQWTNRTWALGQLAGMALTMPIFDNGRNEAQLDFAHAKYDESVANYRQQVLVAFHDVEDNLAGQRLLSGQSQQADMAAEAADKTTQLSRQRYDQGDVNYFQVASDQRASLAAERASVQVRGLRFQAAVGLIRALGGGWDEPAPAPDIKPLVAMPAQQP